MDPTSPLLTDLDLAGTDICATCQHPRAAHDVIGTRWCAATELGIGHRACICSGVVARPRVLSHY